MNGQAKASAPRNTPLKTFLEGTGWENARCEPLAGDASARRYFRMTRPGVRRSSFRPLPALPITSADSASAHPGYLPGMKASA